ncbi:MAG: O-antigen polymerase [Candidatus Saccharibacteria bacterium]|jgi:O-antigen ligase|nr:O-antigen polymerase [Candidatus Saccharibacteria bacterium]
MKLRSPLLWFYLLVASLPFDRIPSLAVFDLSVRPSLVLAAIFIVMVAVQAPKFWWPTNLPMKLLYGFLGICALSAALSDYPAQALRITLYTAFVVAVALAVAQVARAVKPKPLLLAFVIPATVACLFGGYQFVGDLIGLPLTQTGLRWEYSGQVFGFPRIQAMSLEPLYFANYLLLPISILIAAGALIQRSWLLGVLFVTSLMLTLSRGGVGAMAVLGALWVALLLSRHLLRRAGVVVGVGALGVAITALILTFAVPALRELGGSLAPAPQPALEAYTDQVTSFEIGDKSVDRAYTRDMALQAFLERPLIGWGPGNFGQYISARNAKYPDTQTANNEPAELLAETGLAGLLVFAAFGIVLAVRAFITLRELTIAKEAVSWGVLIYLVAVAVQYYSFSTLYVVHIWVAIGLLLGIAYAKPNSKPSNV